MMTARIFYEWMARNRVVTMHMDTFRYYVTSQGAIPTDRGGNMYFYSYSPAAKDLEELWGPSHSVDPHAGNARQELFIGFLGTSFLHCHNVSLERHGPDAVRRAKNLMPARPSSEYHVLNIYPMRHILQTEGQIATTGIKQALHICRGHFKDFREHGLFGKHKGIFWWNQQLRGAADQGTVHKDYHIQSISSPNTAPTDPPPGT